ncbi:bifunctional UDP-N-acetylglucosamine diphosphorylase/glucosamine-1-phosphate N-acetyltransferase GlmU [Candidatus Rariloculus sp.]|uniref:bifunctional UDP-N-acetylglucosamine diphosphorylase/glucosamine-1-phosphate N-acetyltransferase GlmU n=1 Tax=Candidatus Rariloculus sp. TaxID=3101265 RepID=UPI003D09D5C8
MPVTVVILAAGQGKRMRSDLPKVLQPLAGRPLLAHVLERAPGLEPAAIHVVYGHGADQLRTAFGEEDLRWCLQTEQLGTGHAVAQALPGVPDDHNVLVLFGDVPLIRVATLRTLSARAESADLVLLTASLPDPTGYGRILRDAGGRVVGIVEEKDATDEQRRISETNAGVMIAGAGQLRRWIASLSNDNAQGEYYLPDVVAMAVAEGASVAAIKIDDSEEVLGINDKSELAAAERSLQQARARELMNAGATLADPARVDVRGRVTVDGDVFIDVGAVFEGEVELARGVRIGPNCTIRDSRLGPDCVVHANTVMDGVTAGASCVLGPFAHLRPGTELAERVKVGNFVEIKNSHIGSGTKISHLSYVGDATVGKDVNIGAGTITCNYDGVSKHRTTIGDNASIGSGVMLVAPVEVGEAATIGAGSTISKDAPGATLTVARSRQVEISGWRGPGKEPR